MECEVKFKSVIKAKPLGGWYIELTDLQTGMSVVCDDIEEYMKKIEEMGAKYGPDIEVEWSQGEGVIPAYINEIRGLMRKYQEEMGLSEG